MTELLPIAPLDTPTTSPIPPPPKSPNSKIVVIVIVVFIALISLLTLFSLKQNPSSSRGALTPTPSSNPTANWKKYTNVNNNFEFKYPSTFSLDIKNNGYSISLKSPLSKCNPKLTFNIEEYSELSEVIITASVITKPLLTVLEENGGEKYGWQKTTFSNKSAYFINIGAEMISPLTKYLVEINANKSLLVEIYTFGSDDLGRCNPKLSVVHANDVTDQILSTFKFLGQPTPTSNLQSICETSSGGKWLPEYNECEGIESRTCSQLLNGTFEECASACRHNPKAEVCTQNCVPVCVVK